LNRNCITLSIGCFPFRPSRPPEGFLQPDVAVLVRFHGHGNDEVHDGHSGRETTPEGCQIQQAQHRALGIELVRTKRTSGCYATEDTELIEQLRTEAARKLAEEFLVKMRGIGYSPARAAALLEQLDTTKEDAQ